MRCADEWVTYNKVLFRTKIALFHLWKRGPGEGNPSTKFPSPSSLLPLPLKGLNGEWRKGGRKKVPFHLLLLLGGRVKKRERGAVLPKRLSPLETPVAGKAREGERTGERGGVLAVGGIGGGTAIGGGERPQV